MELKPLVCATTLALFLAWVFPGNLDGQSKRQSLVDRSKVIDLTYQFDENTIYWPTAKGFEWKKDAWGISAGGYWYASASFCTSEHGGTHLDSPLHFGEGKLSTAEIPVSRLIGPADVIDITAACAGNRDYRLTVSDILAWEERHGRMAEGDIAVVRTGWGKFWPDRKKYLGSDKPGDISSLTFPGIGEDAARLLAKERKISGIGIDTASLDYGRSKDFIAHQIFDGANVFGLENIAHLERVPETGATLIALPVKIKNGTGGPVRIVAILP
jgi:kynurenine formamidase